MNPIPNQIICSDSSKATKSWPANCIPSIVTDPPYGLSFMGKEWDHGVPGVLFWKEFLRITKPGGFLLCFGGTRTFHRLACAIEDAGWEIRDCMMWLYGSGFPKSYNIGQALEKKITTGKCRRPDRDLGKLSRNRWSGSEEGKLFANTGGQVPYTQELAKLWQGYGTALKPAWEPIIVAMKPIDGTFASNAEKHGVAGLNIDGGKIGTELVESGRKGRTTDGGYHKHFGSIESPKSQGRWPANLILDEEAGKMLDKQSGKVGGGKSIGRRSNKRDKYGKYDGDSELVSYGDSGGASRFFYCPKASRKERNMGMEDCEDKLLARSGGARSAEKQGNTEYLQKHMGLNRISKVKNNHPTVKPLALMKYLCTLVKMPGQDQIILDPFMGSGTTGMACADLGINFIGIDNQYEYCEIAQKRIAAVRGITLPITKNVETFRATKDFAGGGRRPNENLPRISERRQSIINAASAALKEKHK